MRWLLVITALGACGSLAGEDYAGEPLLQLRGVPRSAPLVMDSASFDGAVHWQGLALGSTALTRTPLEPSFPTFWIDVMAWPPATAQLKLGDEPAFAEGYLHLVRADAGVRLGDDDVLATELSHVLIYVSAAVTPESLTARYLGAPFAAGFHVVTRSATTELDEPQQQLVEQCVAAGAAREICTLQHLYQLAAVPADLETVLSFSPL
jgi:hypothetical protein